MDASAKKNDCLLRENGDRSPIPAELILEVQPPPLRSSFAPVSFFGITLLLAALVPKLVKLGWLSWPAWTALAALITCPMLFKMLLKPRKKHGILYLSESILTCHLAAKTKTMDYSHIQWLALAKQPLHRGFSRIGEVAILSIGTDKTKFTVHHHIQQPLFFDGFIHALRKKMALVNQQRLSNGETITGKGWFFDRHELVVGNDRRYPWNRLCQPEWVHGQCKIWDENQSDPVLTLKPGAANAHFLADCGEVLAKGIFSEKRWGKLLFRKGRGKAYELVLMALFPSMIPLVLFLAAYDSASGKTLAWASTAAWAGLAAIWIPVLNLMFRTTRFYEKALVQVSLFRKRACLYSQIQHVTWKQRITKKYGMATYTDKIRLQGQAGRFSLIFRTGGEEVFLDSIRERIGKTIANAWYERLNHEACLPWTTHMALSRDTLFLRNKALAKLAQTNAIAIAEVRMGEDMAAKIYFLDLAAQRIDLPMTKKDFLPGYFLLHRLKQDLEPEPNPQK